MSRHDDSPAAAGSPGPHADGPPAGETTGGLPAGGAQADAGAHVEKAGAFDIRNFIGGLLGLFGVIIVLTGLLDFTADEAAKTGGVNANLWAGIGMLVVAAVFLLWTKLKPIRMLVQDNEPGAEDEKDISALD